MFDPGLEIGQVIKNSDIVEIFKCGNMGGMRRSKTTNTLVLVSDYFNSVVEKKLGYEFCIENRLIEFI